MCSRTPLSLVGARPRGRTRTGVGVSCSPAVSDGTCEAACACRSCVRATAARTAKSCPALRSPAPARHPHPHPARTHVQPAPARCHAPLVPTPAPCPRPRKLGLVEGSRGPTETHTRGLCHWAGEPAGHLPRRRVTEPTSRRARKRQESKPALSTLIARIVPGAVGECDVPVPQCSAFRLLSSLSYSHAWPFAVSGKAKATQVCKRNRTSPVAVEEPPSSRDPTTRPLRRTEEHAPSVTLPPMLVHVIVWCGDTPVVLRSLDDRCERHKRTSRACSARWPASPKGRIESEPRGPSAAPRSAWGRTHRTVPITNRHDSPWFESFRDQFALFWSFWLQL